MAARAPKPRPEVYRLAATLVHNYKKGDPENLFFSCLAVEEACKQLGLSKIEHSMYEAQYRAMFGIWSRVKVRHTDGGFWYDDIDGCPDRNHPWWNYGPSPGRRDARVNALLLMAAIVENPINK
jgi:hypothetical protein